MDLFFWESKLFLVFWETPILFSMVACWFIFHQQYSRVSYFPHTCKHLFVCFLMIGIWHVRWYLIVVLLCISQMISHIEHLFMCWLVICLSSRKSVYSVLLPIFKGSCLFVWWCWVVWAVYILLLFSYSVMSTLCDPMDCSKSGYPVFHCLSAFAQIHVHWVSDAIQPSHSLSPYSPPALNLS